MSAHAAHPLSLRVTPAPPAHTPHGAHASPAPAAPRPLSAPPQPLLARPVTISWSALLDHAEPPAAPHAPGAPHTLHLDITLTPDARATIRATILDHNANALPHATLPARLGDALSAHPDPAPLSLTHDSALDLLHAQSPGLLAATFRLIRPPTPGPAPTLILLFARTPLLRTSGVPAHAFEGPRTPPHDARV